MKGLPLFMKFAVSFVGRNRFVKCLIGYMNGLNEAEKSLYRSLKPIPSFSRIKSFFYSFKCIFNIDFSIIHIHTLRLPAVGDASALTRPIFVLESDRFDVAFGVLV